MARQTGWVGRVLGVVAIAAIIMLAMWLTPNRQLSSAQDRDRANGAPLIARGYTDASTGTAVVSGDPLGGYTIAELRIKEGQKVKRGEVIAVLSNYARADTIVQISETNLQKMKNVRETMLTGPRVAQIALSEAGIKSTIDSNKLGALQRLRSAKPADQKELEVSLAERGLENQKASLELQKQSLKIDLELNQIDIAKAEATLEDAIADREVALVRSPVDGVVTEIYTRQGELITTKPGIAKIVDMRQLRVLAEVDEVHLPRLVPGAKVEITFRGSPRVYAGKIVRAPMTVTRVKRSQADLGVGNVHTVEAEISFDDPSSIPPMLDREARVTFL